MQRRSLEQRGPVGDGCFGRPRSGRAALLYDAIRLLAATVLKIIFKFDPVKPTDCTGGLEK